MVVRLKYNIVYLMIACLLVFGCAGNKAESAKKSDTGLQQTKAKAVLLSQELEASTRRTQTVFPPGNGSVRVISSKPGQQVSVEVDTFMVFNDNISLKEARAQTLQFIRQLALENALPTEVNITSLIASMSVERNAKYDEGIATGIFMLSSSAGRFTNEEIVSAKPDFEPGSNTIRYAISYRAEIVPMERTYNPGMSLDVRLSDTLIRSGDSIKLSVTPNTDGYLYLFDFYADGSAALVFPNADLRDNSLKADAKWEQTMGALCDPESDYSIETLYFVFSTEPISGWEDFRSNRNAADLVFSAGEESFIMFQKWLSKSDPAKRVEKMAQLHIYK